MRNIKKRLKQRIQSGALLILVSLITQLPFIPLFAQDQEVRGTITNAQGAPVAGVTVGIKGQPNQTITNEAGVFSIRAAQGATLTFSSVNFEPTEMKAAHGQNISVVLKEKVSQLTDVVVVGYGRSSRKNLSSAITTIKPDDLNKGAITDVGQLLQGKVPGLNISASGDPNRPAAVVLRVASTLNSSQSPFYVIDGIPGADITAVAPDDIASIDILKDAAATAIYGNRAANGVIMVTTKRGKKGQAVVAYSGYVGQEKVSNLLEMMDANELRAFITANGQSLSPNDDKGANTNWQEAVIRNSAISHNHNLSLSGGGEHSTYSASLNYVDKQGILQSSSLKRVIARLAVEQYASNDKVKFGLAVSNSNSNAQNVPNRNSVLLQMVNHLPISPVRKMS